MLAAFRSVCNMCGLDKAIGAQTIFTVDAIGAEPQPQPQSHRHQLESHPLSRQECVPGPDPDPSPESAPDRPADAQDQEDAFFAALLDEEPEPPRVATRSQGGPEFTTVGDYTDTAYAREAPVHSACTQRETIAAPSTSTLAEAAAMAGPTGGPPGGSRLQLPSTGHRFSAAATEFAPRPVQTHQQHDPWSDGGVCAPMAKLGLGLGE